MQWKGLPTREPKPELSFCRKEKNKERERKRNKTKHLISISFGIGNILKNQASYKLHSPDINVLDPPPNPKFNPSFLHFCLGKCSLQHLVALSTSLENLKTFEETRQLFKCFNDIKLVCSDSPSSSSLKAFTCLFWHTNNWQENCFFPPLLTGHDYFHGQIKQPFIFSIDFSTTRTSTMAEKLIICVCQRENKMQMIKMPILKITFGEVSRKLE